MESIRQGYPRRGWEVHLGGLAAGRLNHANIVSVFDVGHEGDLYSTCVEELFDPGKPLNMGTSGDHQVVERERTRRSKETGLRYGAWKLVTKKEVFDCLSANNIKHVELARALGVTLQAIWAWKSGAAYPGGLNQRALRIFVDERQGAGPSLEPSNPETEVVEAPELLQRFEPTDLKGYRRRNGLRQADLAKLLGVSLSSVSKWEQGKNAPRRKIRKRLSKLFEAEGQRPGPA